MAETAVSAPVSPKTDREFDCLDVATTPLKLTYDVVSNQLTVARQGYDAALKAKKDANSGVQQLKAELDKLKTDLEFKKHQLKQAQERKPTLLAQFTKANLAALECKDTTKSNICSVAQKEIRVLASNNAANLMIDNDNDIKKYTDEIAASEKLVAIKTTEFANIDTISKTKINSAEQAVVASEKTYVVKKGEHDRAKEKYEESHNKCKIEAFHDNQTKLDTLRKDLAGYGITVEYEDAKPKKPDGTVPGGGDPAKKGFDCRYKQSAACQGSLLSDSNRTICRQRIDNACFAEVYNTYWLLDLLSVFLAIPGIFYCIFVEEFTYGLCVGSMGYVMSLTMLNQIGIHY